MKIINCQLSILNCLQLLHIIKLLVVAVEGEELFVGAALHNLSLVEHAYLIGILDGGETVGNGDGGTRLHEALQGFLHKTL